MDNSLYIVIVPEDSEVYQYEYGNLPHALEHYNNERSAFIFEYNSRKYHFVEGK